MSGTTNIPCSYLLLRKGNKCLFVLRQNTGFQDGDFGLVAGHVEKAESFKDAAVREAFEEVGVKVNSNSLTQIHTTHRYASPNNIRIDIYFETTKWGGKEFNKEPEKHREIAWLDLNDLPKNLQDFTAFALGQIKLGIPYSEFGWERE